MSSGRGKLELQEGNKNTQVRHRKEIFKGSCFQREGHKMINRVHPGKVKEAKEKSLRSYKAKRKKEFKKSHNHISRKAWIIKEVLAATLIIKYRGRSHL